MLTADRLREILDYDPETGNWRWKRRYRPVRSVNSHGYPYLRFKGKCYLLHRLAFLWMKDEWTQQVDHIDGNKLNNRWNNLRAANTSQNCANQKKRRTNKSGFKGVCWYAKMGKWHAQINDGKQRKHLGYFSNVEDAHRAYAENAARIYGEFANAG